MIKSWRRSVARVLGVLSLLLAVVLLTGQEADAASDVMKDTRRDTYVPTGQDYDHLVLKPSLNGDITSVRTTHGPKAVNVVIHSRQLRHAKLTMIDIRTSAKHHRRFVLTAVAMNGSKIVGLTRGFNEEINCRGLRVRFVAAEAAIRAHIPRRCLDNPRWVRTGALLMTFSDMESGVPSSIDVAGKNVLTDRWWTDSDLQLPHGSRVRVG